MRILVDECFNKLLGEVPLTDLYEVDCKQVEIDSVLYGEPVELEKMLPRTPIVILTCDCANDWEKESAKLAEDYKKTQSDAKAVLLVGIKEGISGVYRFGDKELSAFICDKAGWGSIIISNNPQNVSLALQKLTETVFQQIAKHQLKGAVRNKGGDDPVLQAHNELAEMYLKQEEISRADIAKVYMAMDGNPLRVRYYSL